jgi:hypothetical protein
MAASGSPKSPAGQASTALFNAVILTGAVGLGLWLLVARGLMAWPPHRLLASAGTLAGCVAFCGPIVLVRRGRADAALGDLIWMTGGVLIWVHAGLALTSGTFRLDQAATPLAPKAMAIVVGTMLIAGWLVHGTGRSWNWTNVLGWLLGVFWLTLGLISGGNLPASLIR